MNVDITFYLKKMKDSTQQHYTVSLRLLNIFLFFITLCLRVGLYKFLTLNNLFIIYLILVESRSLKSLLVKSYFSLSL